MLRIRRILRIRSRSVSLLGLLLIFSLIIPQVSPAHTEVRANDRMDIREPWFPGSEPSDDGGLQLVLSEGAEVPSPAEPLPIASPQPLSEESTQELLNRLPPLPSEPSDAETFRLPPEPLPPPRTGETVDVAFPPIESDDSPAEVESGPLEVLRYAPEGEIPLAPFLNVTFNQPMVPLATVEQLSAMDVPLILTPALPGVWKWIGTKTLTFEYVGEEGERFPMATEYAAEIPAGTRSVTGGTLAETVRWTFTTPAPRILRSEPRYSPQPRDPILFVAFDQRIDPAEVLNTIQVTASGRTYPVRLATEDEIKADKQISNLAENSGTGRWIAFRSDELFPADTTVVVNFGPGTPSAEGPLTTDEVQSYSFQTYAPLRITESWCGWYGDNRDCPPLTPFEIQFNNPIDTETFEESLITVTPEIPGLTVENFGSNIRISGQTAGRTTYKVTISRDIQDIFGQTLGRNEELIFKTGSAERALVGPGGTLVTVDPSSNKPTFTFYSINYDRLRVRAYSVTPQQHWTEYLAYAREFSAYEKPFTPPGEEVYSKILEIDAAPDVLTETTVDLSPALEGDTGHLIVVVDRPEPALRLRDRRHNEFVQAWVQVTQIGIDAFVDHSELAAWTTSLMSGEPLSGVSVSLDDQQATSGEDGLTRLELPDIGAPILIAEKDGDTAFLPQSTYYWGDGGWSSRPVYDEVRWHVFDDRAMYRPGEEVHLKGWVRQVTQAQNGDVALVKGALSAQYQVIDPQGNELANGVTDVNDLGGFDLAFTVPENSNLGYAQVYLTLNTSGSTSPYRLDYSHGFQIQEFRRPEFEVTTRPESEGPFFIGGDATVSVQASYFSGGPLPNAETNWNVTANPGSYSPPNWPDFTFGVWTPWWAYYDPYFGGSSTYSSYSAFTDASGAHYLKIGFPGAEEPRPYSVMAEAVVMDVNRQAWASTTSLLVHPADLYVGLRSDRTFVEAGDPLVIEAIVTDLDGAPVEDRPIEMRAIRLEWKYEKGMWVEKEADPQSCTAGSLKEPVACSFETEVGGEYRISATIRDGSGRENYSQFTRWVSGGQRPPSRNIEQEEVVLIPDKQTYQPGDVAEILVQSPFSPAEGILSLRRNGMVATESFTMDGPTHVLSVPVLDEYIPNLYVSVDLVGAAPRTDDSGAAREDLPMRPAYASGSLNLGIPPLSRELTLSVQPAAKELQPGEQTSLSVSVLDSDGAPVENAELAVVVVDEAILALTNYNLSNPLDTFYREMAAGVDSYYGRSSIVLANPEALAQQVAAGLEKAMTATPAPTMMAAPAAMPMEAAAAEEGMAFDMAMERGVGGGMAEQEQSPITVRTDFNPLAVFAPAVRTDANGSAAVDIKLPDNLTRYRVMVSAVAGEKYFGAGESAITARLPLMVRPSAPRFLNYGDRFDLPVVVQNQTDDLLVVDVAVRAANLDLGDGLGKRIEVPANDRLEVRFPASTLSAGTARLQIAAAAGSFADASSIELPVYTPATTEAFATYGVLDAGAIVQPVLEPTGVFTEFGGLEINTSSTALQALTDAVIYLVSYPFECSEQLASRILGVAALRDVLTAFDADGLPSPEEMNAAVERDIARLQQLQNYDGGFPVWTRGRESIPFYSIHVAHALVRAQQKGYEVPADMLQRSLDHLRHIEDYFPHWYSAETRHALSAYALYVRDLMGDVDTQKARSLLNSRPLDDQSLEAIAWIWQVLSGDPASTEEVAGIRRHVNNRAVETPGAANFVTSYGDDAYLMLHSNRRTDAVVLDAMINDEPDSDLIPKVVNGLLAHRTAGRWNNTQENVFVLVALDRYFNTFESQTPDFVARMWLGNTYVAAHEFEGYSTEQRTTTVPMRYLADAPAEDGLIDLTLEKDGTGRLYYRLGLRYAPDDLELDPLDMGFTVQRTYEAVDDPEDVRRDEDGTWRIKAGARVRVRVNMVANTRRYHVALIDPLPAGLESINPALAVAETTPGDPAEISPYGWWWGPWYEHQNLRDARAEAFTSLLWDGVYEYSYVARATTPGDYVVPPAKAEEMYSPEVFGRSASDHVIVE